MSAPGGASQQELARERTKLAQLERDLKQRRLLLMMFAILSVITVGLAITVASATTDASVTSADELSFYLSVLTASAFAGLAIRFRLQLARRRAARARIVELQRADEGTAFVAGDHWLLR